MRTRPPDTTDEPRNDTRSGDEPFDRRTEPDGGAARLLVAPGTRVFEPPIRIGDGDWAKKVVVGDFTGDGRPDFATLHWETGGRCVVDGVEYQKGFLVIPYVNTTAPGAPVATFRAMPKLEVISDDYRTHNMYPSDLAVGDVNGDGRDDIVVANSHHDRIYVYLSNGDGTFQAPLEIAHTGDKDPCYLALGDFDADGKLDIAVLHLRRHGRLGESFEWRLAFLFGNGDGTFQAPVIRDEGDWSFGGANDDGGGYYKSTTFDMRTVRRSVRVGGAFRDAVSLNGVFVWWDGADIVTTAGATAQFRAPTGTAVMEHYGPGAHDFAAFGGRDLLASERRPGDTLRSAANTGALDRVYRGRDGRGITGEFFGTHVIVEDFDRDGLLDVLWFAEPGPGDDYAERELLLAYGQSDVVHPLTLAAPTPAPELDRIKFFPNPGGSWHLGHRAWRAAVADFNQDGYPDLLTLTAGGVQLHMNYGARAYEGVPPRIEQLTGTPAHTIAGNPVVWYRDQLTVSFTLFDAYPAVALVLRAAAPGNPSRFLRLTPDSAAPRRFASLEIPDQEQLLPGDYDVTLSNGIVESSNSIRVRVAVRPIEVTGHVLRDPAKGQGEARLDVSGFFGIDSDLGLLSFLIEDAGLPAPRPTTILRQLARKEDEVTLAIPLASRPGTHTITVDHVVRGRVRFDVVIPSYQPRLLEAYWTNPDRTRGAWTEGRVPSGAIQPGAVMTVFATNLFLPDTRRWRLLDASSKVIASGSDVQVSRVTTHDNRRGGCMFTLPSTISPGTGYQLGLTTEAGLDSQLLGALTFVAAASPPPPPPMSMFVYVSVEQLDGGASGTLTAERYGPPTTKYDETDPMKPPGALQIARRTYVGKYRFGPLSEPEALAGAPTWDFEGVDARTMASVKGTTQAFSMERAAINIADLYDLSSVSITKHV